MARCPLTQIFPKSVHAEIRVGRGVQKYKTYNQEVQVGDIIRVRDPEKDTCFNLYKAELAPRKGSCFGCDLSIGGICQKDNKSSCAAYHRTDQRWIIFKKCE